MLTLTGSPKSRQRKKYMHFYHVKKKHCSPVKCSAKICLLLLDFFVTQHCNFVYTSSNFQIVLFRFFIYELSNIISLFLYNALDCNKVYKLNIDVRSLRANMKPAPPLPITANNVMGMKGKSLCRVTSGAQCHIATPWLLLFPLKQIYAIFIFALNNF